MPKWVVAALALAILVAGFQLGTADDRGRAVITATVSSAEHEAQEGYFSLGDEATVMAKPGSPLHTFLSRHRGRAAARSKPVTR